MAGLTLDTSTAYAPCKQSTACCRSLHITAAAAVVSTLSPPSRQLCCSLRHHRSRNTSQTSVAGRAIAAKLLPDRVPRSANTPIHNKAPKPHAGGVHLLALPSTASPSLSPATIRLGCCQYTLPHRLLTIKRLSHAANNVVEYASPSPDTVTRYRTTLPPNPPPLPSHLTIFRTKNHRNLSLPIALLSNPLPDTHEAILYSPYCLHSSIPAPQNFMQHYTSRFSTLALPPGRMVDLGLKMADDLRPGKRIAVVQAGWRLV